MKNILLIQVDQMNHRCLSAAKNGNLHTPVLDELISQGCWFHQGRCNNPICLPSRISMLSGMYPSSTKQFGFSGFCDSQITWLPELLRKHGCVTGAFGKMHATSIGWNQWPFDVTAPTLPEDQGFASSEDQSYLSYCKKNDVPYPHDQVHGHTPFGPPIYFPSSSNPSQFWMHRHSCLSDVPIRHSLETWTTSQCNEFLQNRANEKKPFFAWLTYDRPHYPTTLPIEWHEKALSRALTLPKAPDEEILRHLPPTVRYDHEVGTSLKLLGHDRFRFIIATYYTLIEWIDSEIGRTLNVLRETGLDQDTTIVFTSDHGDEAGYRGLYDKINGVSSEEIVRVPLIIRPAPSLGLGLHGGISESPAELVDIYPTLCELHGLKIPSQVEGISLCADLQSGTSTLSSDRSQVCEEDYARSIVFGSNKLVFDLKATERQFYNLSKDPFCYNNLYESGNYLPEIMEGKRRLAGFLSKRIFGSYTNEDILAIQSKLTAPPQEVGICLSDKGLSDKVGLDYFRCAIFSRNSTHELFIPFYEENLVLFPITRTWKDNYRRSSSAIPMDYLIANVLLDEVLVRLYGWIPTLSLARLPRKLPELLMS